MTDQDLPIPPVVPEPTPEQMLRSKVDSLQREVEMRKGMFRDATYGFVFCETSRAYLHGCGLTDEQIGLAERWQRRGDGGKWEEMWSTMLPLNERSSVPTR